MVERQRYEGTSMTSVAATNNAALLILQRAQAPLPQESGGQAGAIDAISAIIYKVAGGDSPVRTQAASQITRASWI